MATGASSGGAGKKRPKKWKQSVEVRISEATRIRICQVLESFRNSNAEVYTFDASLSNCDRAAVHTLSKKMGLISKSSGSKSNRQVSVYKTKKEVSEVAEENLVSFRFSAEATDILQDLFSRYPPNDGEMAENKFRESSQRIHELQQRKDDTFCKPVLTKPDIAKEVASLTSRIKKSPKLRQITEERCKLPIASFKDAVTSTIDSHQVVLISGETGCGKTTQVPQFILDHVWAKGDNCKIVCTQPRRISATSVAERIAAERGENVGNTVGYKIRLESKGGRNSSLLFCTNGILLRVLVSKGASQNTENYISEMTHIIVDEIHERDRYSDFMLAILRDMLPSYPLLRLVLMSATLDAERFSDYFGGCPIIRVPGFTYPVKSFYLEDVLSVLRSTENNHLKFTSDDVAMEDSILTEEYRVALDEAIDLALSSDDFDPLVDLISSEGGQKIFNYQHSVTGITPLMVFAGKGRVGDMCLLLSFGADCRLQASDGTTALDWAERFDHGEAAEIIKQYIEKTFSNTKEEKILNTYLSTIDPELIDHVLIEQLLRRICTDSKDGAILVFLPGWDDISKTRESLLASPFFKDESKFVIISLHSLIPAAEQKKVFRRLPPGCRKIVLSTNIAETSVTIEDVVYVIDSGRMKEKNYDPYNNVSTLQSSWISKASAKQREGRAGRCQPGVCYHLYSKLRFASLEDFQVPEIKRIPIEELCLQVKLLDPSCIIEKFLQKTLDPPVNETIRNAVTVLKEIGALTCNEKLTDLGERLGSLPVHPLTSKMLLTAILLNCLDPALTLACASDHKGPFILPLLPHEKKRAAAAKFELASQFGGLSDQLAVIAAFEGWKNAKGRGEESRFCSCYFISSNTMRMLSQMRKQLKNELRRNGFLPEDTSNCSLNARDPGIIHAVLVAGLYPNVGRLLPAKNGKKPIIETSNGDKVRLHQHSSLFKLLFKKFSVPPLFMFDEITRGEWGLNIRNCGVVGPLPLLLLAMEIAVAPAKEQNDEGNESGYEDTESDEDKTESRDKSNARREEDIMSSPANTVEVIVDRWLPFESAALDVAQIYCLRERLSAAIAYKVSHPQKALPERLGASLYAMACVLSYDGMSGIPLQPEPVDSLSTMIGAADIGQSNGKNKMVINQYPGRRKPLKNQGKYGKRINQQSIGCANNPFFGTSLIYTGNS